MTDALVDPVEPTEPAPAVEPEEGFLETALGVFYQPVVTLRWVTSVANVGWAISASVVVSIAGIVSSSAAPQPAVDPAIPPPPLPVQLFVVPIAGLLGLLVGAGLLQLMSRMLGGRGPFKSLFAGLAFAGFPSVFQIPIQLLGVAIGGDQGLALAGSLNAAIGFWIIALGVIAVREAHSFSTGRALGAVALAFLAVMVVAIVVVVGVLALTIGTFAGLSGA